MKVQGLMAKLHPLFFCLLRTVIAVCKVCPAEMERKGSANSSIADVQEQPGNLCIKNTPEPQRQKPLLWDRFLASHKDRGLAFPTTSCNLLLVAGGRFYTDHALRLPWVSLQDVSIRGGYAQIVAGAASHLPSSRGARTHEDDYNETEEPHMLAIINQHGSAEFLHKALLVCAAFAFFFLTSPPFCNLLLRYVLENNNITFQSKELLSLFSWKVKWALNTSFWNELLTVWSVSPHSSGMCSDFSLISASAGHLSQWLHL